MTTPIMAWDSQEQFTDDVVWWTRLDGRYQLEARRFAPHRAKLYVWDRLKDSALIFEKETDLIADAIFGPDVANVADWQGLALDFVDHTYLGGAANGYPEDKDDNPGYGAWDPNA